MSVLKPNNQKSKRNNEQGAVMFVSVFAVTLFILLAAMIMDFGLFYYKQARLQNAGDAAATAVAASIDATDKDLNAIAKQYLYSKRETCRMWKHSMIPVMTIWTKSRNSLKNMKPRDSSR